jgi:peroxiredoxin
MSGSPQEDEMTATRQIPAVGEVAPDVSLPGIDGRTIRFSDFRGKRLMVFMWASW